jgi:dTDP-4-amino-4,6-dideoxygalactose transaminase
MDVSERYPEIYNGKRSCLIMLPYGRHEIEEEDIARVVGALRSDWLTTGPLVEEFERKIEEVVGAPTVTVSSGTAALHCAYAAIGLEPDDEVITPPITFIATQATAALFGAKIRFADVQEDTANIDPEKTKALINNKTRAIVAVDYAGHPADLDELRRVADCHNLFLIEDAAHSIGSKYKDRKIGSIADLTTFSFFPTKNITSGEGGAISSHNANLLESAKVFARQGLIREDSKFQLMKDGPWHQEVHEFGLNYRLPDILCALGISQISRIDQFKAARAGVFEEYSRLLSGIDGVRLPTKRNYVDPMWHLYPIRVPAPHRKRIFESLRNQGIGVQVNYLPAHLHPVFKKTGENFGNLSNSLQFYSEEISLPMMANNEILNESTISFICNAIKDAMNEI